MLFSVCFLSLSFSYLLSFSLLVLSDSYISLLFFYSLPLSFFSSFLSLYAPSFSCLSVNPVSGSSSLVYSIFSLEFIFIFVPSVPLVFLSLSLLSSLSVFLSFLHYLFTLSTFRTHSLPIPSITYAFFFIIITSLPVFLFYLGSFWTPSSKNKTTNTRKTL